VFGEAFVLGGARIGARAMVTGMVNPKAGSEELSVHQIETDLSGV
jgi:hypothetical protein